MTRCKHNSGWGCPDCYAEEIAALRERVRVLEDENARLRDELTAEHEAWLEDQEQQPRRENLRDVAKRAGYERPAVRIVRAGQWVGSAHQDGKRVDLASGATRMDAREALRQALEGGKDAGGVVVLRLPGDPPGPACCRFVATDGSVYDLEPRTGRRIATGRVLTGPELAIVLESAKREGGK